MTKAEQFERQLRALCELHDCRFIFVGKVGGKILRVTDMPHDLPQKTKQEIMQSHAEFGMQFTAEEIYRVTEEMKG